MNRRLAGLGAAAGLILACCLVPAAPAGAAPVPGGSFSGDLTGVSCVSASDCWAVGGTSNNVAITEHWDGSAWSVVHIPAPHHSYTTDLPSISCPGVASCWAVGDYGSSTTNKELPYAEHWNGTAWSVVTMPHPAGAFDSEADSVSCATAANCWAVGTAGSPTRPLLERWNGLVWALQRAPAIAPRSTPEGVSCARASDCWITGLNGKNGTLAAHWNGHDWSVTPTPTSGKADYELLSTSCVKRDCMSVGDGSATLAERWNGSAWAVTPSGHTWAILAGVSCFTRFHCLATGNTIRGRVFSEVWNGSAWYIIRPKVPHGSQASGLAGVDCVTATDCWSVGDTFNGVDGFSLIEHWNGKGWSLASG